MRYLILPLVLAAGSAHAQYRCVAPDGATSLQQAPCPAGARSERLVLAKPAPARPDHILAAIGRGHFVVGMTRAELDRAAGRLPQHANRTVTPSATLDQLVYGGLGYERTVYVHLRDGIVESISASESDPRKVR
jgi:hypothetical protein